MFNHGLSTALILSYSRALCYESSFYTWFFHPHMDLPPYICPLELQKYANSCSPPSWISLLYALQLIDITPIDQSVALQSKATACVSGLSPRAWMSVFCYGCVMKVAASVKRSPLVHRRLTRHVFCVRSRILISLDMSWAVAPQKKKPINYGIFVTLQWEPLILCFINCSFYCE